MTVILSRPHGAGHRIDDLLIDSVVHGFDTDLADRSGLGRSMKASCGDHDHSLSEDGYMADGFEAELDMAR